MTTGVISAGLVLLAAAVATWLLRVLFITIVPADRLPARVRRALPHVGPAILAALIVTSLVQGGGVPALLRPTPEHLALLAAGLVALRWRNLVVPMAAALLVMTLAGVLA